MQRPNFAMPEYLDELASWGSRALNHARRLTVQSFGRGSATPAEAQAAAYVQSHLQRLGLPDVRLQAFQGLRSIWLFLGLVFGFAMSGHLAFWLSRPAFGPAAAAVLALAAFGLAGFLFWRKFTFRDYPLRRSLPHGPSQNVIAVLPPRSAARRNVVLIAHLDSHRAVLWYAADFLMMLYALIAPLAVYGLLAAPLAYLLSVLTGWQFFVWIGLSFAPLHFLSWFSGMTADLGPYSPGANDNASAVGTLLALVERLQERPLEHTEVWLAFTGCEESGCDGLLALLEENGPQLREAIFIDFEMVGIGDQLVYLKNEGLIPGPGIPEELEKLVVEAGREYRLQPMPAAGVGAFTEAGALRAHGYPSICLLARRSDSPLLPEWHRPTDTPDRLERAALERIHDFTWNLLQRLDEET